jgi:hypothetical protein
MDVIDHDIDYLYQLGLDVFIAERNALARRVKRPELKVLEKPSVPAWVVNQLFWHDRSQFDRVVETSEALRSAHRAMLSGIGADVRAVESAHRDALRDAMAAARQVLTTAGLAVSPSTLEAVSRTLEALPHPGANGRLVRPLSPAGLEALAGLAMAATTPTLAPATALRLVEPPGRKPGPAEPRATASPTTSIAAPADNTTDREALDREARAARERQAQAQEAREQAARDREARQRAADEAVRIASDSYRRAQAAVAEAEAALSARRAERDAAAADYEQAKRAARDVV